VNSVKYNLSDVFDKGDHGRISLPSQAKHLPLCLDVKLVKTSNNFWVEYSGVNSFP